jgi:hypothetical protein
MINAATFTVNSSSGAFVNLAVKGVRGETAFIRTNSTVSYALVLDADDAADAASQASAGTGRVHVVGGSSVPLQTVGTVRPDRAWVRATGGSSGTFSVSLGILR